MLCNGFDVFTDDSVKTKFALGAVISQRPYPRFVAFSVSGRDTRPVRQFSKDFWKTPYRSDARHDDRELSVAKTCLHMAYCDDPIQCSRSAASKRAISVPSMVVAINSVSGAPDMRFLSRLVRHRNWNGSVYIHYCLLRSHWDGQLKQ